jgi:hypothetical protein
MQKRELEGKWEVVREEQAKTLQWRRILEQSPVV